MADNVTLNSGSGGATLSTDDIAGVHVQRVKIQTGADGAATDVSAANPLPVSDNGGSLTVDGSVNATLAAETTKVIGTVNIAAAQTIATTNAGTFAVQSAQSGTWTVQPGNTANTTAWKVDGSAVTQPVSGTVTATIAAGATTIAKAEDVASADADVGVPAMAVRKATPANTSGTDGDYEMLQMSAGRLWASATIDTALPAGTNAIGKLAANAGVTIGAVEIAAAQTLGTVTTVSTVTTCSTLTGGGVAHDGVDSGNPHKIGAKATTSLAGVTTVANADRTDCYAGIDGVIITRPHCNLEDIVSGNASNTDGTSTSCIAAQGAGVKTYLTNIILTNTSTTATYCEIKDGTTVKLTIPVPASGGASIALPVPLGGSANTAWNFDPGAATTTMYCSMIGFKSKV